jgi:hypothetical protein
MDKGTIALRRGLVSGATSSLLSTAALAVLGKAGTGSMFAPTNAISHWFYGKKATRRDGASLRYTGTGYLIHHLSATFWAVLFERAFGKVLDRREPLRALEVGAVASAVACFTDYQLTPPRLRPGYEERLSKPSLAVVYAAFGVGLAAGALLCRREGP